MQSNSKIPGYEECEDFGCYNSTTFFFFFFFFFKHKIGKGVKIKAG